jgi:phage anti-repressor protein
VQSTGLLNEQRSTTAVAPLLTDSWGQGCYYNNLCPEDANGSCGHVVTGCVATSFAQILHYWGYPATGMGSHTYTPTGYPTQTANFGATTYNWANMPNSLSSSSSSTQVNAVATLMWHCGVAVEMNYGPTGSGASSSDIPYALVNYFGYSENLSVVSRDNYGNSEWLALVKGSLDLARPVHLRGSDENGGGGHAFVCDGYNNSDQLHINWGWYGNHNGYFAVGALNVSGYAFNVGNVAIINIYPNCTPGSYHQITASASSGGSVSGGGSYGCGNECTLTAVPANGYIFCSWTENGTVVSTESTYTFTVLESRNLVANFAAGNGCTIVFNLYDSYGDGWNGNALTVSYSDGCIGNEELTIENGSSATISRTVVSGNHVVLGWITGGWTSECSFSVSYEDGTVIYEGSDLSGSFSYEFDVNCYGSHIVSTEVNPSNAGTASGDGTYQYGESCTVSAMANEGYIFTNWTKNDEVVSDSPNYTFVVEEDCTLVANFSKGHFIGDGGDAKNLYLPSYSYYNYSLTQQIYTAAEIGMSGLINSVSFLNGGAEKTRSYDVYMVHTDKSTFANNNDWIAVTEADKVFSGTVTMAANTWTALHFDISFIYNGTSNLALIVDDNSGNYTSSPHMQCRVYDAQGTQAIRIYNDYTDYDPSNPSNYNGTLQSVKNQIVLGITEGYLIGDGSDAKNYYLPSYSYYKYSLTQQIYTASEIGMSGLINSVSFFNGGAEKTRSYDVYMVHTDKSFFDNNYDWIAMTEADRVFSGTVTMAANTWTTLQFDIPFVYNGTSNLALIVDDNSGNYTSGPHMRCRVYDAQGNQTLRIYSDNNNYDPYNPSSYDGVLQSVKNQIVLGITEGHLLGDGGDKQNLHLPSYSYYNYSFTQQIYTASEIDMSGLINSVSFLNGGAEKTRSYDVYMVHTDKSTFANNNDWIAVTEADKVFSGTVTMAANTWTTLQFDIPFAYNGTSNLALIVDDNSGNYTSSPHMQCRVYDAQGTQAIRIYSDHTDYDPCNPSNYNGTLVSEKNQIVFGITSSKVTQTINLAAGWNWFSTCVKAANPVALLDMLKAALGENGVSIESRNDGMTEFDGEDWFGDMDDVGIYNEQMYLIQTNAACTIQLQGKPARATNHPITINPGWNWIGYPCDQEMNIADAFANFEAEEGDQLESKAGYTEFDGEDWFGEIETLMPGHGFLYYSTSTVPKTLIFQMSRKP